MTEKKNIPMEKFFPKRYLQMHPKPILIVLLGLIVDLRSMFLDLMTVVVAEFGIGFHHHLYGQMVDLKKI